MRERSRAVCGIPRSVFDNDASKFVRAKLAEVKAAGSAAKLAEMVTIDMVLRNLRMPYITDDQRDNWLNGEHQLKIHAAVEKAVMTGRGSEWIKRGIKVYIIDQTKP